MTNKTIKTEYGTVHYWIHKGDNEGIVFTHGATMDHGMFRFQEDYFSKKEYTLISWDVPAHGLSRPFTKFSLETAADVLAEILNKEKIVKAHLAGQSMGGYISQIFAFKYPEKTASLCAIDSSPLKSSYYSAMDRWLFSITKPLLKLFSYTYLIKTIAKQIACTPEARDYALEVLKNQSKEEIAAIMGEVYRGVANDKFNNREVQCPLIIICGEKDKTGKVISYSRRWAAEEEAPLIMIPDAAHNANMDNPLMFNKAYEKFLNR